MKENESYKIIDIERPFYFLCGPNLKYSKKRNVLAAFLRKEYKNKTVRPFPIIVDEIFDSPNIENYNLDMVLLEEIVAATSLKTYIFLDSLSTAYELGLFKNSKSYNSVRILVESSYRKRKRREIGYYIRKSIGDANFLKYKAESSGSKELEFYEFNKGKISKNIVKCIEKEMSEYKKNIQSIELDNGIYDGNPNKVFVKIINHDIEVTFSLKSLFYMMQKFLYSKYTSYKQIIAVDNKAFDKLSKEFYAFIKREILINLGTKLNKVTIFNELDISIDQFDKDKVREILRHIYFFFVLLNEAKSSLHRLSRRGTFHDVRNSNSNYFDISVFSFFDTIDNKRMVATINSYLNNPDAYVESISYVVNKKLRKIYKYKDNYKGRQLRYIHESIVKMLGLILPSNPLSFAYKEGQNTLKCFGLHKESCNFLKLDIHHYFESIRYRKFIDLFKKQIKKNLKNNDIRDHEFYGEDEFNKYIKALFYKGHIPLGFVSSPKVSDFYLESVDDWAGKLKGIKYSRYADDILMSTKDINYSFSNIKASFEKRIDKKGLAINPDKVINKKLINNGDCIKFLGICLVKKDNENEIRISKHYLKEVIKECYKAEEKDVLKDEQIMGKIRYIKLISEQSYERLLKALSSNEKGSSIASTIKYLLQ